MHGKGFTEEDWKLFCKRIVNWQEAYLDKLNKEYIALLSAEGNPAEKFWELDKRLAQDKKKTGVTIEMSRSNLIYNIISLLNEGVIDVEDLDGFSDDLKRTVRFFRESE